MSVKRRLHPACLPAVLLALGLAAAGCTHPGPEDEADVATVTIDCSEDGTTLNLNCPAVPVTNPQAQPGWDYFAWNTFVALGWPAVDPSTHNEQRGFPDLTGSFGATPADALVVWETFKEKREVFFENSDQSPGQWNQAIDYGGPDESIPVCASSEGKAKPERFFAQGSEIPVNSLDETVEVASEALESGDDLCRGYSTDPQCGTPNAAECCSVHGLRVGPRVWLGTPTPGNEKPVLYEVKVNYDFFEYVVGNQYYLDSTAATAATGGNIRLPYRTSAQAGPLGGAKPSTANPNRVLSYTTGHCLELYAQVTPTSDFNPCPMGAVHLKAAWLLIDDIPVDQRSTYKTAEAVYYKTENGSTCMAYGTFGLVGLHIIQRIHQGEFGAADANPPGGTFIFATWEHIDNDSAGFTYANDYQGQGTEPPPAFGFYPHPYEALAVTRKYPILDNTQQVNAAVHQALGCQEGSPDNSVWCNYQLIGTQFQSIDVTDTAGTNPAFPPGPNDPTGIGQPLYLANLVIETNDGLQQFQGQPPLTTVISHFSPPLASNDLNTFVRGAHNMTSNGTAHNMGGCMGCHGVAQSEGFSFSFVLLGGQRGAGVDTQKSFEIPPPPPQSTDAGGP